MIRRTKVLKVFLLLLTFITVTMLFTFNQSSVKPTKYPERFKINGTHLESQNFRLFHLDLKGAPPKMKYILEILPLAKKAGANGILIEYEDVFPWSGFLRNISAGNAYSREEINNLVKLAKELELEIIPLVQTFGHLEFVLKLQEFRHLRELDIFPQEICPNKQAAFHLIKEMIRQIMEVHGTVKYLHIGCDEVYHLGACSICSQQNPRSVFSSHVRKVGHHVRDNYPGVIPIIWDDMLRRWPPLDIEDSGLGDVVEPMVWVYIEDIPRLVPNFIWYVYKRTFRKIWGASAFKGAFGEKEVLPNLPRHFANNLAWQNLMSPPSIENTVMQKQDFRGIALTGWSRYDHFAVLAELLPLAIPSLILNLALAKAFDSGLEGHKSETTAFDQLVAILHCSEPFPFHSLQEMKSDHFQWVFGSCVFPGSDLYHSIQEYFALKARFSLVQSQRDANGWVSMYNVKYNYSSPHRVLEMFPEEGFAAEKLHKAIANFKSDIAETLKIYYDEWTAKEWVEQKIEPMEKELNDLSIIFQRLVELKVWARRPLITSGT